MSIELVLSIIAVLAAIAAGVRGARWMSETADLRISLFRPYHADAWPKGVQEEDVVQWRWDAATGGGGRGEEPSAARRGTRRPETRGRAAIVPLAPLGRVHVGRRRGP